MIYGYGSEYYMPGIGEGLMMGAAGIFVAILIVFLLVVLAISVASYVLGAMGLHRIAKRRGIHHAWLAWIPVANSWLLGSVSDHYQYVVEHKITKRRRVLLILAIVSTALSVAQSICTALVGIVPVGAEFALGATIVILSFVIFGVAVALMVMGYIAYYDLFRSCKPGSAVLFLVLGIVFSFALPFFVFAISGSDKGMPERRAPRTEMPQSEQKESPFEEEIPVVEAEVVEEPFEE